MTGPYDDIISLPHPTSAKHPRMPLSDRAAQFAPFAALSGHSAALAETARLTDQRMELDEDARAANSALWTLRTVLGQALKLLHPYMPFITEEIYCTLNPQEETIMLADWPVYKEEWNFSAEEEMLAHVKELVKGIRNLRTEMDVPPSRKAKVFIVSEDKALCETFESMKKTYQNLISASEIDVQSDKAGIGEDAVSVVIPGAVVYMPLEDLVDMEKEKERLLKEEERLKKELARSHGMLNNEKFVSKAPAAKIQEEKDKLAKYEQMMATVQERLAQMK